MKIEPVFLHELTPLKHEGVLTVLLSCGGAEVLERCEAFAKRENAAVVTPLFFHDAFLCAAYIDADRTIIQRACFPDEGTTGNDVTVFEAPFGRLALACGADIFQPQYARLAALRGCELLIARTREPMSRDELIAGPWSVVQANCLPVAVASETEGQLVLPCPMTADSSGLGRAWFDSDELHSAYAEFPVFHSLNPRFLARYAKELS